MHQTDQQILELLVVDHPPLALVNYNNNYNTPWLLIQRPMLTGNPLFAGNSPTFTSSGTLSRYVWLCMLVPAHPLRTRHMNISAAH